jgi:SAM-dependent methyltransferase
MDTDEPEGGGNAYALGAEAGYVPFIDAGSPTFHAVADMPRVPLNTIRLEAVLNALKGAGAQSVIDLGCGEGSLLRLLLKDKTIVRIAGADVSAIALERAGKRLHLDTMNDAQRKRIALFQTSLFYRDTRTQGFDAAAVVEVMEHLDENRLAAFARVLFGFIHSPTVVITTPNVEYNENYDGLIGIRLDGSLQSNGVASGGSTAGGLTGRRFRHGDHRFEWTREQFRQWAEGVAKQYGYCVRIEEIGSRDEERGAPTQMGVFTDENRTA